MGGSRQRLAISSKSTLKRQKQYFQQRRLLQQQQQHEHTSIYTQHHESSRSLDVLSLQSLTKNGQGCISRSTSTQAHQTVQTTIKVQMETKVKIREESKLSVFDILDDDDEEDSSSRGNLVHEKHAAFSVVGLREVEMETPFQSQHPSRNFSYEWPGSPEFFMPSHSSKNLDCSLELFDMSIQNDMAFDVDGPTNPSPLDCMQQDANDFLRNAEHDAFKWGEKSSFLDHKFVDDNCGLSWTETDWSCDLESSRMNHKRSRNCDEPDFSFEDWPKRRCVFNCFNAPGLSSPSPSPSYEHQMEHSYPSRSGTSDFRDMINHSALPPFKAQEAGDCFSSMSEDS